MNFEIEQARREFFNNCEYVVRAPACIFFEGDRFSSKAKVLPIPQYAYAGIEKGKFKQFEYEEFNSDYKNFYMILKLFDPKQDLKEILKQDPFKLYAEKFIKEEQSLQPITPDAVSPNRRLFYYPKFLNKFFKDELVERKDNIKKINSKKSKEYFKVKVWSDIKFESGLCESSAIATAVALLLFLELNLLDRDIARKRTLSYLDKLRVDLTEEVVIDYDFIRIFGIAQALDFFSNGASVSASLLGCARQQEIINYECLIYDRLESFFKSFHKIRDSKDKPRVNEKIKVYFDMFRFKDLFSKIHKAEPLFKWNYEKLDFKEKLSLSIIKRFLMSVFDKKLDPMLTPTNPNMKSWEIFWGVYAVLAEPELTALCERYPEKHLFNIDAGKTSYFDVIYSSRKQGWGAKGVGLISFEKPKEAGKPAPSKKEFEEKKPEVIEKGAKEEKVEYEIWMPIENNEGCECEKVNQSVVEERFEELRKGHKLFIDNRYRYIYINGKKVNMVTIARRNKKTKKIKHEDVKISFIKYNLLIWFLQNKDKLFNHERLYKIGWSNPDKSTEEVDLGVSYKESLKNQISILNAIFKALGLSKNLKIESERPLGYYCEGNCDFRILKKINPENTSL